MKKHNEGIKVRQNPAFLMELDEMVVSADAIEFSNKELHEGATNWKLTLVGCVAGTEVRWKNMDKFVRAHWKEITPPAVVRQNGVFLFQFHS